MVLNGIRSFRRHNLDSHGLGPLSGDACEEFYIFSQHNVTIHRPTKSCLQKHINCNSWSTTNRVPHPRWSKNPQSIFQNPLVSKTKMWCPKWLSHWLNSFVSIHTVSPLEDNVNVSNGHCSANAHSLIPKQSEKKANKTQQTSNQNQLFS